MAQELSSSQQLTNTNLSSFFMSDLRVIGEIHHVVNRATLIDPSSLDFFCY